MNSSTTLARNAMLLGLLSASCSHVRLARGTSGLGHQALARANGADLIHQCPAVSRRADRGGGPLPAHAALSAPAPGGGGGDAMMDAGVKASAQRRGEKIKEGAS